MFTTILLSVLLALALSAVVCLSVKLYKSGSGKLSPGEEITDTMIREMLVKNGYQIVEDKENPDWIHFEVDSVKYFIRICEVFCEIHSGMLLQKEYYDPALTRHLCDNAMRSINCCHLRYDAEHHALLSTVFSIQKSYAHLQSSFYDMMQCMQYGYTVFNDLYHKAVKEQNSSNKCFS